MSPNEMKKKLESQIDALSGFVSPAIPDTQASNFLNQAIQQLLKKAIIQGVEKTEYNKRFVAPLKKSYFSTPTTDQTGTVKNGQFWELPDDFYLMLSENVISDVRDCFTKELIDDIDVYPISEDFRNANIGNHQKSPYINPVSSSGRVWSLSYGDTHKYSELITDGTFHVYKYNFRYLKKPTKIKIDLNNPDNQIYSEIYDEYHDDIINAAALIAIENMRMQSRFQTKAALNMKEDL